MTKQLTTLERAMLQRFYDGEASNEEAAAVESLLNESSTARVFMQALEEITEAMRAAEDFAWERADAPTAEKVAIAAAEAAELATRPLEELAPLLERFWDGEVVPEEMATVSVLLEERDDVAEYLAALEEIRETVRASHDEAVENVSFDGFWESLEGRLDEQDEDVAAFDPDEHRVLLYRYHDDEVSGGEKRRVETWVSQGNAEVVATLDALAELRLATTVAVESAQARVEFNDFWHAVENGIDDAVEAEGENVVSLNRQRRERKGFLSDYRQGFFTAVAAMLCVAFVAGLFKKELFGGGERVIVEKTVVIVDSVEYQPGSSVMVNSPMKPVSATTMQSADGTVAEEEAEPTVIWLIDTGEAADDGAEPADDSGEAVEEKEQQKLDEGEQLDDEQPI